MKKVGVCLLAYGEEHIKECKFLINCLKFYNKDIKIFIGTDSIDEFKDITDINLIEIDEPFNYHLKRKSIKIALKECDVIVIMDTDIILSGIYHDDNTISKINFDKLNEIEDGMYSDYIDSYTLDLEYTYQKKIYELSGFYTGFLHVLEHIIIIKITDEKVKERFLEYWEFFYNESLDAQPLSLATKQKGAMEGLLIHCCIKKSGLNFTRVFDNPITNYFFSRFYHYANDVNKTNIIGSKGKSII